MKGRILVIDDESNIRFTLHHFLSEEGYGVETAKDYKEAVTLISKNVFDLIITDIILEGKSGIDVLREINNRNMGCPVIIITGVPDFETASDALRLGAFDYITKPVKKHSLLHVMDMALKHKSLHDEKNKYRLHLETVFRSINEGIVTIDEDGRITDMNRFAITSCGYSLKMIGHVIGTIPMLCNGKCHEILNETITSKKPVEVYRHECKHRVVSINTTPLIDDNGNLSGAMLLIRDETHLDNLERDLQKRTQLHNLVGESDRIQKVYSLIENLADVPTTVLIRGESGTGKELVADALHYRGNRRGKPMIKVNCSALQDSLLESELFGYVKGAFTGAHENRDGRFQKADKGTIFLDEIGDISKKIQLKLLRVLQSNEFERVGDSTPIKVDLRLITATNQDLINKVRLGDFREDLYYRLKVVEIAMPPLRENKEDIPLLVDHFIRKFNIKLNRDINDVSSEVTKMFMDYHWPGNVRELEHTIEHAFIICHGDTITTDCLPADLRESDEKRISSHKGRCTDDSDTIIQALKKCRWNISKAARLLGVSRPTMYRKMKEMNLITD